MHWVRVEVRSAALGGSERGHPVGSVELRIRMKLGCFANHGRTSDPIGALERRVSGLQKTTG